MSYFERTDSSLVDNKGNRVEVGVFGGLKSSSPNPQISITFDRPLSSRQLITSGTPAAQVNRSLLAVANGDSVATVKKLRYRTAQTIETFFTAAFEGAFSGTTEETLIGLFDNEDGVYLGYIGADFVVGYRNINVGADVIQIVTPPPFPGNIYRYRIVFGYLGVGDISYEYKKSGSDWTLLHTFPTDGTLTSRTHIGSPVLPICAKCEHAGCRILSGSWNAQTYGSDNQLQELAFSYRGQRSAPGNVVPQPLVAFRNRTVWGAYPNKIVSQLLAAEFATGSEGLYVIEIYPLPAGSITTGAWVSPNPESVLEANTTFTGAAPLTQPSYALHISVPSLGSGIGLSSADITRFDLSLRPGEEAAIYKREIISGGGNDTTSWALRYIDRF